MGNNNDPPTHTPSWRLPDTFNKYSVTLTTVNDKEESIQLTYTASTMSVELLYGFSVNTFQRY